MTGLQPVLLVLNECDCESVCQRWRAAILCAVRGSLLLRKNSIHLSLLLVLQASYYELVPTSLLAAFHVRDALQICMCTPGAAMKTFRLQYEREQ